MKLSRKTDRPSYQPSDRELQWISVAGWSLFSFWASVLVINGFLNPDPYAEAWLLVLELAFMGQLVSVADGIASGFSTPFLLFQNILQDIILLLVVYPWIVRGYRRAPKDNFLMRRIENVRRLAERHKSRVQPFGAIGLWAFVFFPFWSTGPLVGGTVGYLLGLRTSVAFTSVFIGHALSVTTLVVFFDAVHDQAASFSKGLAAYLPWIVAAIILTGMLLLRLFGPKEEIPETEEVPDVSESADS
jgi:uncharacterized membrane protein